MRRLSTNSLGQWAANNRGGTMLNLFKKSIRQDTLAAVCPEFDGIAVAQVRKAGDVPPTLELCEYRPFAPDDSQDRVLANLVDQHHLDRTLCVSLVDLGSYSLIMVEAPDVQADELRAAVRWRVKDLIDFHVDDAVIDVFEVPDTKAAGRNQMMYAVVARASVVKQRIDQMLDAGLRLEVVDIPELALRNIAALLPEDVGGVGLIYVAEDQGLITITRQETLYLSRRIAKGTNSLPDTATISIDQDAIENWLDTIIVEVQRSLDYYESHFSLPAVSNLVITPLARDIPGVAEYVHDQLDIPTRMLDVNSLIDVKQIVAEPLQAHCLLAIGAALRDERVTL